MTDTPSSAPAGKKKATRKKATAKKRTTKKRAAKKTTARKPDTRKRPSGNSRAAKKRDIDPATDPWCGLDEKHMQVAEAYLADPRSNQTAAWMAVYPDATRPSAQVAAARLFATDRMRMYLDRRRREIAERLAVTAERVLEELAKIAFCDPADVMSWDGRRITLKGSHEIPTELRAAIQEVSERAHANGGRTLRVKMASKIQALDLLGKSLDLWKEAQGDTGPALVVHMH